MDVYERPDGMSPWLLGFVALRELLLIGRPLTGGLEYHLNRRFETEDRVQADRAFEELKAEGLIRPTYADLVDPENWVEITEA